MGVVVKQLVGVVCAIGLCLMLAFYLGWFDPGYGKVSEKAYALSKALYGACLNKNEEHLAKVENLLSSTGSESLSDQERVWLKQIVDRARQGSWDEAAKNARRMMDDQVVH